MSDFSFDLADTSLADEERQQRIYLARNRVDITVSGVLEKLATYDADGRSPEVYEALAAEHPIRFHGGVVPASEAELAAAHAFLLKKNDKANLAIRRGADVGLDNPRRLSFGNLTLDWITGGGLPRAVVTQFKSRDGAGKTTINKKVAARTLRMGGSVLWCAAEFFSSDWARKCGLPVLYSQKDMDPAEVPPEVISRMQMYNRLNPEGNRFFMSTGKSGNEILQLIIDSVLMNVYDLIVLDSIAVLRSALHLDKKNVGDETRGGEASLFNDFCSRVQAAFNTVESNNGKVLGTQWRDMDTGLLYPTQKDCPAKKSRMERVDRVGSGVRTAISVINQMRDQGLDGYGTKKPEAPGGHGLKHAKGLELEVLKWEWLAVADAQRQVTYGKRTLWQVSKSKVGPEMRMGAVEIHVEDVPGVSRAGEFGMWTDMFGCAYGGDQKIAGMAELAGALIQRGAYYDIAGQTFHGRDKLDAYLTDPANVDVLNAIRSHVAHWIEHGK